MLILSLDTTARTGSCALMRDDALLLEQGSDAARPPAARLPGDLMTLLAGAGIELDEIDAFAVAIGPGSFTGLRIGIATMQGLAFAGGKPLLGVTALDALASLAMPGTAAANGIVVATWIDAWRGEVYAALHDASGSREPVVARPESLLAEYRAHGGAAGTPRFVFIGDGAETYRALILDVLGSRAAIAEPAVPPLAAAVARLAMVAAHRGGLPPPHAIRPLYVRRADAELARERS